MGGGGGGGMGKVRTTATPLVLQSKLLCFSLLYLVFSLFLVLYTSLPSTRCLFRSSPFDPLQSPLFSYPSTYGEHKYAIPTHRFTCDSPIFFSEYSVVFEEIQGLCQKKSPGGLRYLEGKEASFGGNLSTHKRFSYFDLQVGDEELRFPCGFFKDFPVTSSDRAAMDKCEGVVVVSAIFGDHDKIRQPSGLGSKTLDIVCFFMFVDDVTLQRLDHHKLISKRSLKECRIGAWRVVKVSGQRLYDNAAMNGVIPKFLVHRLFPNTKYSIWIDAKLQLMIDPLLLIHSFILSDGADMAISRHPSYIHTVEEASATARWNKWPDIDSLRIQMETYCANGLRPWTPDKLPYTSDVPDSALILRKHGDTSNLFSCLLFNELEAFSPRDQLAFAFVRDRMTPKLKLNMFEVEVFEKVVMEYRHNLKRGGQDSKRPKTKRARPNPLANQTCGMCQDYLLKMWDE